jgi:hypothetical protein
MADTSRLDGTWQKSTRSGHGGNECVEVLVTESVVMMRDSKNPDGPVLEFSRDAWIAFVAAIKRTSL